jgi:ATP synthase F1 delta subunit
MANILVAKRYVTAAIQNLKPEKYQEVSDETFMLKNHFHNNPDMRKWLSSSIIKKNQKIEFFKKLTEHVNNKAFWDSIFNVFVMKNRCNTLFTFLNELDYALIECLNEMHINLILAHEQDKATEDAIKSEVEKILKCKVVCDVQIDKDIIGGFIVMGKNQIIDASVRSQLNRFAKSITVDKEQLTVNS